MVMINVLLIAGGKSKKLADFLEGRGTFSVPFYYENLYSNITDIQNQIIKVDKLLYLYQIDNVTGEPSTNIKSDMQALRNLLNGNGFFSVSEIILIVPSGQEYQQAIKYFNVVMQECGVKSYSIKPITGLLSFAAIYDAVMGVSSTRDFQNSYLKLYRVSRGSDASLAYSPNDDSDLSIEPFRYDSVNEYEQQKKVAKKIESGVEIYDTARERVEQFNDPHLGQLSDVDQKAAKTILISGKAKSGKSVWVCALAKSCTDNGKSALILDFTECGNSHSLLAENGVTSYPVKMLELLSGEVKEELTVCAPRNGSEFEVRFEFLQNFFSYGKNTFDVIFVICEVSDYLFLVKNFSQVFDSVCFNTSSVNSEVFEAIEKLQESRAAVKTLILNDVCNLSLSIPTLEASEVKELSGEDVRVVKSIIFKDFEVGKRLFNAVVG